MSAQRLCFSNTDRQTAGLQRHSRRQHRSGDEGRETHRQGWRAEIYTTCLRHFFASWCINPKARGGRELPPKQVQYLLGHSTISMTFDTYGHLFPSEGTRDELTAAVRQLLA
jgi:integrase